MKKIAICLAILFIPIFLITGCSPRYVKYSDSFFNTFDTMVTVVAYTKSENEFEQYFETAHSRFLELHKLFDKYNTYDGINNIKTINDNAGIKPVKVEDEIIDMISFAKDWYESTDGKVNIALGSVLDIWHKYREDGLYDPSKAQLPPMDKLNDASGHTDIKNVIVDRDNGTVYLADKGLSLDVGAVAKGCATELVAQELMANGMESGILSAGGNIRVIGKPLDGERNHWSIGLQDPDASVVLDESNIIDTVYVEDTSVVTSGDYQRYYTVDGKVYHHLIDPDTLMPANYFRSVSIVTEDSGIADLLSTAVFLMPYDEGSALIDSIEGVEAFWIMPDKTVKASDGMKTILKSYGASSKK